MKKIGAGLTVLAVLVLAATTPLTAQEAEEEPTWSAEAGLTLQASGGNEELTVFTTTVALSHLSPDVYELALDGRFRYGENEGQRVAENLSGALNMDFWPRASWSPFLFVSGEQDPIKKLDLRLNGGAGAKRTFWQDGWNEVSTSAAILYSYENLEVPAAEGDGVTETARWSFRVRGRKELGESSRLEQVVFFQPAYDQLEDYQMESVTKLRVAVSGKLSFLTDILYQRDNTPAPGVGPDDYSISVGLSVATEW